MTGQLQQKVTVPPFMEQNTLRRSLDRQPAENERPRREPQVLCCAFPIHPNKLNRFGLPKFPFGNPKLVRETLSYGAYSLYKSLKGRTIGWAD